VVEEIDGVVKLVPVPREEPPTSAAYQLSVPDEADALSVTVPVPHRLPGVVDATAPEVDIVTGVLLEYSGQ
jgi:hypothetical protein